MAANPWGLLILYFDLAVCATAGTVYCIWSVRWWKRKQWSLFAVNFSIVLAAAALVAAYLIWLGDPVLASRRMMRAVTPALFSTGLLALPAISRLLELRLEHKHDATVKAVAAVINHRDDLKQTSKSSTPEDASRELHGRAP